VDLPGRKTALESPGPLPLTRKIIYDLSLELRQWASDLARCDPSRVNLQECHRFNAWLRKIRGHETLATQLVGMKGARPVARWQVLTLLVVAWGVVALALLGRVERNVMVVVLNGAVFSLLAVSMAPAAFFGTTVEQLEGKLLRVVELLEAMLSDNSPGFSEGAYFSTRANLEAARRELREQIDLAHRR